MSATNLIMSSDSTTVEDQPPAVLTSDVTLPPYVTETEPIPDSIVHSSSSGTTSLIFGNSPIAELRDICGKHGIEPRYELVSCEGPVHQQVFTYCVNVGQHTATASGSSKKKARHTCATLILRDLGANAICLPPIVPSQCSLKQNGDPVAFSKMASLDNNPIGKLQELTQKKHIAAPLYTFDDHGLQPHERYYTCTVVLEQLSGKGIGRTKKVAKRAAAESILIQLTANDEVSDVSAGGQNGSLLCDKTTLSSTYSSMAREDISFAIETFTQLRLKTEHQQLPLPSTQIDYQTSLQEVADHCKFDVTYVDISEMSSKGLHQCFVQLSTMPVVLCRGVGESKEEAHIAAALSALRCLCSVVAQK